jgi:hypothetical protein
MQQGTAASDTRGSSAPAWSLVTLPGVAKHYGEIARVSAAIIVSAMLVRRSSGGRGMQRRTLGGLEVSAVGLGCATMTPFYDEPDEDAAIDTLRRAREIGVDFLDSSPPASPTREG